MSGPHIYGTVTCDCDSCKADRAAAAKTGEGALHTALDALETAKGAYPVTTREWRALDMAAQRIYEHFRWRERHLEGGAS